MTPRFPYDTGSIHAKLIRISEQHAGTCQGEIVRLREQLMRAEAEIARLKRRLVQRDALAQCKGCGEIGTMSEIGYDK